MHHYRSRFLSVFALVFATLLILGGHSARSATEPKITSISPEIGPLGTTLTIRGTGFHSTTNTIDWGFGRAHNIWSTGAPSAQTITVTIGRCPTGEICDSFPTGSIGKADVKVINENGTSNTKPFILAAHASQCYFVDNFDDPTQVKAVACTDPTCNAGSGTCEVLSIPSPTPTPSSSPLSDPTPSPTPQVAGATSDDDDDDDDDEDSSSSSSSNSSKSAAAKRRVASKPLFAGPTAADKKAADYIKNADVVGTVDSLYRQIYGNKPSHCASDYWKTRARADKATRSKLKGAMQWQKSRNKNPAFAACVRGASTVGSVSKNTGSGSTGISPSAAIGVKDINKLFRAANNGQNPTPAQNRYWQGRLKDKKTAGAMIGAMTWHRLHNTGN